MCSYYHTLVDDIYLTLKLNNTIDLFVETLCNIGMIEQLVGLLSSNHETFHEHLFAALFYIVTDNQQAQTECHRPEFKLQLLLRERKKLLGDREEYLVNEIVFGCPLAEWHKLTYLVLTCRKTPINQSINQSINLNIVTYIH